LPSRVLSAPFRTDTLSPARGLCVGFRFEFEGLILTSAARSRAPIRQTRMPSERRIPPESHSEKCVTMPNVTSCLDKVVELEGTKRREAVARFESDLTEQGNRILAGALAENRHPQLVFNQIAGIEAAQLTQLVNEWITLRDEMIEREAGYGAVLHSASSTPRCTRWWCLPARHFSERATLALISSVDGTDCIGACRRHESRVARLRANPAPACCLPDATTAIDGWLLCSILRTGGESPFTSATSGRASHVVSPRLIPDEPVFPQW